MNGNLKTPTTSKRVQAHCLNDGTSKEAARQMQDGKRTLIKNQLYLIEQLQLENANLRNERDQLQLENEELKFQLQMISSSNILGQTSSGAFDNRQLDKLVGTNSDIDDVDITLNDVKTVTSDDRTSHSTDILRAPLHDGRAPKTNLSIPSTDNCYGNQGVFLANCQNLTKIAATPVRQPMRLLNSNALNHETGAQNPSTPLDRKRLLSSSNNDLRSQLITCPKDETTAKTTANSLTSTPTLNKKLLNTKSISLNAFNVKSNIVIPASASKIGDDHQMVNLDEDDHELQLKRVQKKYGDSERIHSAATIIQRAYREYRICKRFRTITEQLRLTCNPTNSRHDQKRSNQNNEINQRCDSRQSYQSTSDNFSSKVSVPYAFGATRAATCESLTQAANHLAANAAAATSNRKRASINGVAKSVSCQQVAAFASGLHSQIMRSSVSGNVSIDGDRQLKSDSVVAAAINFQQLESIRKRQYRVGLNIFNKNPEKGISFLIAHSFIDCSSPYLKAPTSYYLSNQLHFMDKQKLTAQQETIHPSKTAQVANCPPIKANRQQNCRLCHEEENLKRNVAHFLLHRKGLAKEKIGEYLGNLQSHFIQDILVYYLQELDFNGLQIDVALRKFSSTLRMPGEAQKIERFVDRFASRYVDCQHAQSTRTSHDYIGSANDHAHYVHDDGAKIFNHNDQAPCNNTEKNNLTMLSKDEIFILTFAIIMLNTDLHSPSLKSTTRMSANQFINNLRGVFKSQTINESDLIEIYERVKASQITTSPDHVSHVMKVQQGLTTNNFQKKEIPNLCVPHRRLVCFCRLFEVYDVTKKERLGQHQREIFLFNDILLVTKLARKSRANAPQQYTFRQSIPLEGLYVQLSQSAHYNFGIKLCRRSDNETVIMFNARNELDQGRFVDDLNESISEMDEMGHIRAHNIVDAIHLKQLDRLRRHALMHEPLDLEKHSKKSSAADDQVVIMEDTENDQDNSSSSNYSSFNSNSADGSLIALCTKPARMRCTVTMAAPAPIVVEPLDK